MAPVRRRPRALQGPFRLDWLLRGPRRRAPPPPPPSPSPSPPPVPPPSLSPPPSHSPSAEMMPNASPSPIPLHASPGRTPIPSPSVSPTSATSKRKAEESPLAGSDSDGDGEISSAVMAPPQKMPRTASAGPEDSSTRASPERIPAAPIPPSPETIPASSGEAPSAAAWRKAMALLQKIRALPPSTFRPFYPRTVERGTRSVKEAKSWTCQVCQNENRPTNHLLFDLPAANCEVCGFPPPKGAVDFAFCFGDLGMNGFCPIGNVKKQKGITCVATALSSAVEITHRVMMIVLEEVITKDGPFIKVEDLLEKYDNICIERGVGPNYGYDLKSLLDMLTILVADGVIDLDNNNVHCIAGWTFLGADDFAAVCAALADGYPLITGHYCGKRAALLKPGEVYVPPPSDSISADGKRRPVGHCVVLVGAVQEGTEQIVYYLNSAGKEFCERCHKEGDGIHGGIGAIRFKDLFLPPIQILRFNERRDQVNISQPPNS